MTRSHSPLKIGVVAPGSAPKDNRALLAGLATLEARGFQIERTRAVLEPYGYLCGTDEARLAELNHFLRRDDLDLLICVRGGFGALRLLPGLDYAAARRHPKLLVGYSDITALHLALYHKARWRGLSGPMVAVEWDHPDPASERLFWDLVRGGTPAPLLGPGGEALVPVRPGEAEGILLGGNLSLIVKLIGTPYLPPLDGAILFLEEVGEAPYRIDGMLAHLRLAGILDRLGGLILGGFTDTETPAYEPAHPALSVDDVFDHYFGGLACPVARGLQYGHFPVKNTIPVGVRARLSVTADAAALAVLEPVAPVVSA